MSTDQPQTVSSPNSCEEEGAAAQLLCLIQDPFASQFKAAAIWTALATSVGVSLLIMVFFCLIRPRNNVVYAPKLKYADDKHAPPVLGKGLFDWTPPLYKLHEVDLVDKIGLDATIYLRFNKMLRNMFAAITVVAAGAILPTNLISGQKSPFKEGKNFWTVSALSQYIPAKALWVHVIGMWAVNIIIAFFLWRNYIAVTRLRRGYYDSEEYLKSLHARTLMFTDIPPASRTDEGILRLADEVEQTTGIPRAAIARNVKELPDLIEKHEAAVKELESVLAKYLKNPDRLPANRPTLTPGKKYRKGNGGGKVDAIDYLTDRISELEMEITLVRESIDKRNPMPYGFASFEKIEEAHTVAYAARKKHPQGTTIRLAPKPNDLIWKNLPLTKKDKSWKRFINNFWIGILTVVWIAPNAMIAVFLSNLANLASIWNGFKATYRDHPKEWAIVQGIASPAITSLIYILLPIAFRRLSMHAGDTTKTSRERHVTTKLYAFFVFNNLIIFSVFSAIWAYVAAIIDNSKEESVWEAIKKENFFFTIMGGLIEVAPFWLTWLLQRNLGAAADLAQMIQFFWVWWSKTFTRPTPRQMIELTRPVGFDYAVYYNYLLFYATIALCFTALQPLVIPVTGFYFALDYFLKKYLLLYVFITKTESGGQFWRILFNRMIFATILANIISALIVKAKGDWAQVFTILPLVILMLAFKIYCARTFDPQNDFYTKALLKDPEHPSNTADPSKKTRRTNQLASKFGHPALYAKLMTPMVHANAKTAMSHLYRGRLDDFPSQPHQNHRAESISSTYTDIAMTDMSSANPGKIARFAAAPNPAHKIKRKELFELVPSHKLDFGYFKNRADFAEEGGGDGELYGRPTDLVSERSGTPLSFFTRDGGSGSSSRASSPAGAGSRSRGASPAGAGGGLQHPSAFHTPSNSQGSDHRGGFPPRRHVYGASGNNESESNLLRGAQPVGVVADEDAEAGGREQFGLERWRTGGSGYVGVPGGEGDFGAGGTGYEFYRHGGGGGSSSGRGGGYEPYRG